MVSLFTVMAHQIIFRTITKFQFDLYGSCEANLQFLFILSERERGEKVVKEDQVDNDSTITSVICCLYSSSVIN